MRRFLISSNWQHLFESELVTSRFVYDTDKNELVAVQIQRGRRWFRATRRQHLDIEDSAIHSQPDLPDDYRDYGMTSSSAIPDWAVTRKELHRRQAFRKARSRTNAPTAQIEFDFG